MDGAHPSSSPEVRRKRFSAAEVQIMLETGVLKERERVELVGGELVQMSPQGPLHWDVTYALSRWFRRNLPDDIGIASQGPFRLGEHDEPEPEFFLFADEIAVNDVRGSDALLVIEVAHSSLDFDLKIKGPLYAAHHVREYWIVDVENRCTLVHSLGADGTYGEPTPVAVAAPLSAPGGGRLVIADLAPKA